MTSKRHIDESEQTGVEVGAWARGAGEGGGGRRTTFLMCSLKEEDGRGAMEFTWPDAIKGQLKFLRGRGPALICASSSRPEASLGSFSFGQNPIGFSDVRGHVALTPVCFPCHKNWTEAKVKKKKRASGDIWIK